VRILHRAGPAEDSPQRSERHRATQKSHPFRAEGIAKKIEVGRVIETHRRLQLRQGLARLWWVSITRPTLHGSRPYASMMTSNSHKTNLRRQRRPKQKKPSLRCRRDGQVRLRKRRRGSALPPASFSRVRQGDDFAACRGQELHEVRDLIGKHANGRIGHGHQAALREGTAPVQTRG
jgi:hypothetical protein